MSIYNFNGVQGRTYQAIYDALSRMDTRAVVPSVSIESVLQIYNKAISENRNGIFYKPGYVETVSDAYRTTACFNMVPMVGNALQFGRQVELEIWSIVSEAERQGTLADQARYIYRYFVDNFSYAYGYTIGESFHCAYSPFANRKAVCEGFAFAFSSVLNRLNIPCGIVMGRSSIDGKNEPHAWNIVKLGSRCYHVDVTWGICTKQEDKYFLINDATAKKDHIWNDDSIPIC